ncbi:Hint domain-containing protein [Acidisoma cellulosilytica]|uniref:Hint domain-containing protein n=1 Tax=Acidisoma cellulosilyticum TaxID=2802395 RepID=A0A963Z444_9PROT|nr:Hint domain-containing protein [Acidisoma cellulosilyticum]MCB8882101.1 Hint domain-containing protein [Acidisoma cellulosilyticum]
MDGTNWFQGNVPTSVDEANFEASVGGGTVDMAGAKSVAEFAAAGDYTFDGSITAGNELSLADGVALEGGTVNPDNSISYQGDISFSNDTVNTNEFLEQSSPSNLTLTNVTMTVTMDAGVFGDVESSQISAGSIDLTGTLSGSGITTSGNGAGSISVFLSDAAISDSSVNATNGIEIGGTTSIDGTSLSATTQVSFNNAITMTGGSIKGTAVSFFTGTVASLTGTSVDTTSPPLSGNDTVTNSGILTLGSGTSVTTANFVSTYSLDVQAGASITSAAGVITLAGIKTIEGSVSGQTIALTDNGTTYPNNVSTATITGTVTGTADISSGKTAVTADSIVNINAGGRLISDGNMSFAEEAGIASTVTVKGGEVQATGTLAINGASLIVMDGADVSAATLTLMSTPTPEIVPVIVTVAGSDSIIRVTDNATLQDTQLTLATGGSMTVGGDLTISATMAPPDPMTAIATTIGGLLSVGGNISLGANAVVTVGPGGTLADGNGTISINAADGTPPSLSISGSGAVAVASTVTLGNGSLTVSDDGILAIAVLDGGTLAVGGTADGVGGNGSLTIASGGVVDVADVTIWKTGHVKLSDGELEADSVTIAGGDISGNGTVTDTITDDGSITASGGKLELTGAISGTGSMAIDDSSLLRLDSADDGVGVTFLSDGSAETLSLAELAGLTVSISGFASADLVTVDLLIGATASFSTTGDAATLTFTDGFENLGALVFAGSYTSSELLFDSSDGTVSARCYAAGTRIAVPGGERAVEDLTVGDTLLTLSGRPRRIKWIGRRAVDCRRHRNPISVHPIKVWAGAFGPALPRRDLFLSPDHAVFAEGVLIPVKHLVNGSTVSQVLVERVTYFHLELDSHDILLAEGLPAESYLDTGDRHAFAGGAATEIHPAWGSESRDVTLVMDALGYAPLQVAGPEVDRVKQMLSNRATQAARIRRHG